MSGPAKETPVEDLLRWPGKHPDGEAHWRKMADDRIRIFLFTNREAREMLTEIDRLRQIIRELKV